MERSEFTVEHCASAHINSDQSDHEILTDCEGENNGNSYTLADD